MTEPNRTSADPSASPSPHPADAHAAQSHPVGLVLAAGRGTRMGSDLPKVLHPVAGRAMIHHVLDALAEAGVTDIVVIVGYRADLVRDELASRTDVTLRFRDQTEQRGTGHAVMMASDVIAAHHGPVVIVCGDSPMLQASSVKALLTRWRESGAAGVLGSLLKDDPTGLGRIVRDDAGAFLGIVEHKDATDAQRAIREVNMSTYVFEASALATALTRLTTDNAQGEYYLTDVPRGLSAQGHLVEACPVLLPVESLSINTPAELALVEAAWNDLASARQHPGRADGSDPHEV